MSRIAAFIGGVAASGIGYVAFRRQIWDRTDAVTAALHRVEAGIPDAPARSRITPIVRPALPVIEDPELFADMQRVTRNVWNAGVASARSAAVTALRRE